MNQTHQIKPLVINMLKVLPFWYLKCYKRLPVLSVWSEESRSPEIAIQEEVT